MQSINRTHTRMRCDSHKHTLTHTGVYLCAVVVRCAYDNSCESVAKTTCAHKHRDAAAAAHRKRRRTAMQIRSVRSNKCLRVNAHRFLWHYARRNYGACFIRVIFSVFAFVLRNEYRNPVFGANRLIVHCWVMDKKIRSETLGLPLWNNKTNSQNNNRRQQSKELITQCPGKRCVWMMRQNVGHR